MPAGDVPKGVEEVDDTLKVLCGDDIFCEVTSWGLRNLTRNLSCLLYASGCSQCGIGRSDVETAHEFRIEFSFWTARGVLFWWNFASKLAVGVTRR